MTLCEIIEREKMIVIVRRIYGEQLERLADALYEGGIRLMEVTFDQADEDCIGKTFDSVRRIVKRRPGMYTGAGTVLTEEQADAAREAGGQFIVSPNVNPDLIRYTKKIGLVSIPGAMTPSEIIRADESGADFVKVFPADFLGEGFLKSVMSPINHVRLIAAGGVDETSLPRYLKLGMCGAGVGGKLVDRRLVEAGEFGELKNRAAAYVKAARSC